MQNSLILIANNSGKKKTKGKASKVFNFSDVHFYDMTHAEEQELKPMPASGAEVIALIEKYDIRNFGESADSVAEKIKTVRASEFGERYLMVDALEADPAIMHENWLLHNKTDLIDLGIKAVKKTCNFTRTAIVSRFDDIQIKNVSIRKIDFEESRPSDAELIKKSFDVDLEEGSNEENGVLVLNVQTVITIGLAASGVDPTTRFFTLANFGIGEAKVVRAPFGYFGADILNRVYGKQPELRSYAGPGALNAYPLELFPEVDYTTELICYAKDPAQVALEESKKTWWQKRRNK